MCSLLAIANGLWIRKDSGQLAQPGNFRAQEGFPDHFLILEYDMAKKGGKRDGSKGKAIASALAANPSATAKELQGIVAKSGTSVSLGMIAKVKAEHKSTGGGATKPAAKKKVAKKKRATKGTVKKKAPAKKGARRGRKPGGGPTKSDAIRAYMAQNPNDGPAAIRDALAPQGIKKELINQVYYKARSGGASAGKKRGPGRPRKVTPAAAAPAARKTSASALSASQLLEAKSLADKIGGIAKVREALDLIEKLA